MDRLQKQTKQADDFKYAKIVFVFIIYKNYGNNFSNCLLQKNGSHLVRFLPYGQESPVLEDWALIGGFDNNSILTYNKEKEGNFC